MENLDWTPLKGGGSNYRTKKFKMVSDKKVIFEPTKLNYIFPIIFCGMPLLFVSIIASSGERPPFFVYLMLLLFFSIGIAVGYFLLQPVTFDFERNIFYKGYKPSGRVVNLSEVKGIQIINEYVVSTSTSSNGSRNTSRFYSYEINLVLTDGRRVNVVDHGDKNSIIEDTKSLARLLNVPVYTQDNN